MAGDGSIIIETKLDTTGIEQGLQEIEKAIESRMGDAESGVQNILDGISKAVGNTDVATGAGKLVSAIAQVFREGAGEVSSAAGSSAEQAGSSVEARSDVFRSGGYILGAAAAEGLSSAAAELVSAAADAAGQGAAAAGSTEGQFSSVGQNLMSALRSGISSGAAALYAKAAAIASSVVSTLKGIFGIHSPSKVFRDEIGKMLMLGLQEGILDNSEAVLAACAELAEDMLEAEREYIAEKERIEQEQSEADEASRVKEYEKKLAAAKTELEKEEIIAQERLRLKKKADEEYLSRLKENAERQREVVDQLKSDITAVYKDIAEYAENSLEPIIDSRSSLESKLKDYSEANSSGYIKNTLIYTETEATTIGARKTSEKELSFYTLADQQESIDMLLRYSQALELVRERIKESFSPETAREFMSTLAEMDVEEGTLFAETLAAANDRDFGQYIEKWETKNELAEAIARQFYSEEFTEAVDDCTEYMRKELEALGMEIPDGFFASGSASAEQFGKGFSEGLNEILEDARLMIESFGAYADEAISGGFQQVVNNNNFYSSYSINGTKSTTAESIYAIEAASTMNKYRGLN